MPTLSSSNSNHLPSTGALQLFRIQDHNKLIKVISNLHLCININNHHPKQETITTTT